MGCPAFPFIDQGGAEVTDGRKKKNQRPRRYFEGAGSSFSSEPAPLIWQTVPGVARSLILIGPCSGFVQQVVTSHPASAGGAAHHGAELRPYGSRRGSDHTSISVDDVSSLLDHSGCHMIMLGSTSEG